MTYEEMMEIHKEMEDLKPKEKTTKGWQHKSASFRYQGIPVTRNTYTLFTPLGTFRVYETVSGKCWYEYPRKSIHAENENHISFSRAKMPCDSIDQGKTLCRNKWDAMKLDTFNINM